MIESIRNLIDKALARKVLVRKIALVSIALILVLIFLISYAKKALHKDVVRPAYIALKCVKCGHNEDRRIFSLLDNGLACSVCNSKLGYRLKCLDCEFEFAFIPQNYDTIECIKDQRRRAAIVILLNQRMCPNCGSPRTINVLPAKRDDDLIDASK